MEFPSQKRQKMKKRAYVSPDYKGVMQGSFFAPACLAGIFALYSVTRRPFEAVFIYRTRYVKYAALGQFSIFRRPA